MPKYILSSTVTITPATASTATPVACEIKLGLDIHQSKFVVVAQHDHATPKAPRHFAPAEFLPWVDTLLRQGHRLYLVYEACGFGFGLCRQLRERGVNCQVVAPQRLDERHTGVKTDGRDARTLCLRLDRWLAGNADALAVIRIPTPEEEQRRQVHRQREQLVHQKTKLEAQGRSLLVNQGLPAPSRWWKTRAWEPLQKLLPAWIVDALAIYRPLLALLDAQIKALGETVAARVEQTAVSLPKGGGRAHGRVGGRRGVRLEPFYQPLPGVELHGVVSGRVLQRGQARAGPRHQAWQPATAGGPGRTGLADGAFPAGLPTGAEASDDPRQGRTGDGRATQEGHRRRGAPARGRSLAAVHGSLHRHATGSGLLKPHLFIPTFARFGSWQPFAA